MAIQNNPSCESFVQAMSNQAKPINPNGIRYCVDGHEFEDDESNYMDTGEFPPFMIFDIAQQLMLPGEYKTRADAETVMALLKD